jgi:hypothetical protein
LCYEILVRISFVDVVSEVVGVGSVVTISGVVHVLSVGVCEFVGVLHRPVSIIGEEEAVPSATLLALLVLLVAEGLIVRLESSALGYVQLLFRDHCGVGAEVRALVPGVALLIGGGGCIGEGDATKDAGAEEPPAEGLASLIGRVYVGEIVDESLLRHDGDATLVSLSTAADPDSERRGKNSAEECVDEEGVLELILDLALVLPGPALGVSGVLAEAESDPGVRKELIVQPVNISRLRSETIMEQ